MGLLFDFAQMRAFLAGLGVPGEVEHVLVLGKEIDVLAHPASRSRARRQEELDTLVEFLSVTGLSAVSDAVLGFRTWLSGWLDAVYRELPAGSTPPRAEAARRMQSFFGTPGAVLASQFTALIENAAVRNSVLPVDSLHALYFEARDVCTTWANELESDDYPFHEEGRCFQGDESFALEQVLCGIGEGPLMRRFWAAERARQFAELIALAAFGAADWHYWAFRIPSLGWPALLSQALGELADVPRTTRVSTGDLLMAEDATVHGTAPPAALERRFGQAACLLREFSCDLDRLTVEDPGRAVQRIMRTYTGNWDVIRLHAAELCRYLDEAPNGWEEIGLPAAVPVSERPRRLRAVWDCLDFIWGHRQTAPEWKTSLDLSRWEVALSPSELRELCPEVRHLLTLGRAVLERGGPFGEEQDPEAFVQDCCDAYTEARRGSVRYRSALVGEIRSLFILFADDEQLVAALGLIEDGPWRQDPVLPYWYARTWRSWLREVAAEFLRRAGKEQVR